jgi:hypothetical protein
MIMAILGHLRLWFSLLSLLLVPTCWLQAGKVADTAPKPLHTPLLELVRSEW